jgi:hypothetical protein
MPKILSNDNNIDARARVYAQMEVAGYKANEIRTALNLDSPASINCVRKRAYEQGYVQKLQEEKDEISVKCMRQRENLALRTLTIMNNKAMDILDKEVIHEDGSKEKYIPSIAETKLAVDMLNSTEFTGRKNEAPEVIVNQNIQAEQKILTGSLVINTALKKINDLGLDLQGSLPIPEET